MEHVGVSSSEGSLAWHRLTLVLPSMVPSLSSFKLGEGDKGTGRREVWAVKGGLAPPMDAVRHN